MMPVLVTTNTNGLAMTVRVEMANHSVSVGGRPTVAKRFDSLMSAG
jgi:hypothetical protein